MRLELGASSFSLKKSSKFLFELFGSYYFFSYFCHILPNNVS